jgi:hypothetical protein
VPAAVAMQYAIVLLQPTNKFATIHTRFPLFDIAAANHQIPSFGKHPYIGFQFL